MVHLPYLEISKLEKQVDELKVELEDCRHKSAKVLATPSSEKNHEPAGKSARSVAPLSGRDGKHTKTDRTTGKRLAPTGGAKLYSEVVGSGTAKKLFQLTVKSIGNTTQENATELLKSKDKSDRNKGWNQQIQNTQ